MANKRIADDFLYGNRERRKERRTLRKKNILERKIYNRNAKRLGDPKVYTNAMLDQMRNTDKGEMSALRNAQEVYTPIINSNRTLSKSLSNINSLENQLYGSSQTTIKGNNLDTKGIINVSNEKKNKVNPIKNIIGNIKENVKTRKLRKQSLKGEYNKFIDDMKLIEGDNFNEDRVPSYRKWKKKWNKGDFVGVGIADKDKGKDKLIINPAIKENIQKRETAVLENRPEKFSNFDHLFKWQTQAGDYKFKDGEKFQIGKDSYTYKSDDGSGSAGFVPTVIKTDKSLYSYQKVWDLYDQEKGPLYDKWGGNKEGYFKKYDPDYDYSSSSDEDDFNKYVEISQGWWDSDSGQEYKDKHNIKRKKQMGGIKKYQTGGEIGDGKKGFKEAFREAKNAGKKTFMWNGKSYHTRTKEEGEKKKDYSLQKLFAKQGSKRDGSKSFPLTEDDQRFNHPWSQINQSEEDMKRGIRNKKKKSKKQTGGCKKCGGMYQDGGFLSPPVPRLFEN